MADVKWIKIVTDIFDNRKIKQIRKMPDADAVIVIWFEILCLAGSSNQNGLIFFDKDIPYTDEMFANAFDKPINTIKMALNIFERFNMIEMFDDVYCVSNWVKYQNSDALDVIREKTRARVEKHREKQKELTAHKKDVTLQSVTCNVTPFSILISNSSLSNILKDKLLEWIKYKTEKKQLYKETGMRSLILKAENQEAYFGADAICEQINDAMANNWQGIQWDKLKGGQNGRTNINQTNGGKAETKVSKYGTML